MTPDLRTVRLTRQLVAAGVIGGLALASGVALTATSGWLIVKASERPVILTLMVAIVGVRAFGMARPAFRYWERLITHDAALRDLAQRRVDTYAALIPLTPARLGRRGRADLLTGVVDDLDDVVGAQIRVTVPGLSALIAWGITTAVTTAFDARVGLCIAVLGLVVTALSLIAFRVESAGNAALGAARADVTRVAETLTAQAGEIAAIGAGPAMLADLDRVQQGWYRVALRQARGRALAAGGILLAVGATTWAVAHTLFVEQRHTAPVAALLVLAPVAVADALTPLAEAARALARARGSATRLAAVLDQQPAVAGALDTPADAGSPPPPATDAGARIALRDISARWSPERPLALDPLDLDLPVGEHLAIVGPNGSGKSTLLAVLARHLDPETGSYAIGEADALSTDLAATRRHYAVVDDTPHIFASTLRENLRFAAPGGNDAGDPRSAGVAVPDDELRDALRLAGLGEWLAGLPDGLGTRLGTGGRGISGGERARLGLARALVSGRPAILLDEPVAHLDSATAREVINDLVQASSTRTLVMVSHRDDGRDGFQHTVSLESPTRSV